MKNINKYTLASWSSGRSDGYVSPQKNTKAVDPSTGKRKQCGLR